MNTVFIVPTGIGASIGGDAGDATPAFKLVASVSDISITHPNVVNASDINEMPPNTWYVEGSMLDRFLAGEFCLKQPKSNKILLVTNPPIQPETVNAVNTARHTIGCNIEILELTTPLEMTAALAENVATGVVLGWKELVSQISNYEFDALAIATRVNCPETVALDYLQNGGVNPWGGVEAIASRLISQCINKPVAHAPVESTNSALRLFNKVVPPRIAAEVISQCYLHCVFKGLHKAPRRDENNGLNVGDIDCLISPYGCFGPPHKACIKAGIPVIVVESNKTRIEQDMPNCIFVKNYLEAVGYIQLIKTGMTEVSVK